MRNNGHASLDGLLDALAQRVGNHAAAPRDDDAIAKLGFKVDKLAAFVQRLAEAVENRPANDDVEPILIDRHTAAKSLSISPSMLDNLRRDGVLPAVVLGKSKPMWLLADLKAFVEEHREQRTGTPPPQVDAAHEKSPAVAAEGHNGRR